jgi:phospholipid/cholesterol/gamma-HCH transport system permease protein
MDHLFTMPRSADPPPTARWVKEGAGVILELSGRWHRDAPPADIIGDAAASPPLRFVTDHLLDFDSTLPAFLLAHLRQSANAGDSPKLDGLPPDLHGLMELALAVPEEIDAGDKSRQESKVELLGDFTLQIWKNILSIADFTGQSILSFGRLLTGKTRLRARDFWAIVQECGAQALPIVSLISFLIGLILAFVGNVQLANFGASLYIADLVGIAMVREMGVVMTAIIMSGRTGAAFAAHLGSMKANEEIDALRTFGFNPFDFLVLPRLLALVLMMPILTLYANAVGILGGMLVGAMVGIPPVLYWNETLTAVDLTTASLGVFKSVFFGAAIAISGCLQGMNAGNSSAAVGQATTRAVVASITAIIVLDSAFAAIFTVLGI